MILGNNHYIEPITADDIDKMIFAMAAHGVETPYILIVKGLGMIAPDVHIEFVTPRACSITGYSIVGTYGVHYIAIPDECVPA